MAALESLVLSRTPLGPEGLSRLANLPNLKRLILKAADVTDAQLPLFNTLPQLEELDLYGAQVSDEGLTQLNMPQLKILSLADCRRVTDAGLSNLAGLTRLESLNLCGSSVAGRNLKGLAAIATLRTVMLAGAQFRGNDHSIAELKDLLPGCEVLILRG
jgi:hypothetical protein